jgi:FkbM family methyltransferase
MIKKNIKKIFAYIGIKISKKQDHKRMSLYSSLEIISKYYKPDLIIDVGAAYGDFYKETQNIFSDAKYILCEPLIEYVPFLDELIKTENQDITFINKAIGEKKGKVDFYVHDDLVGSSTKKEVEGEHVDGKKIEVEMITLDEVYSSLNKDLNILFKVDVQGAELEVLKGAENVLEHTEIVILEVSFFKSMINGAGFYEIVDYMYKKGFVVYDIISMLYRPYDKALSQADVIFVKEEIKIREFKGFATKQQRLNMLKK